MKKAPFWGRLEMEPLTSLACVTWPEATSQRTRAWAGYAEALRSVPVKFRKRKGLSIYLDNIYIYKDFFKKKKEIDIYYIDIEIDIDIE